MDLHKHILLCVCRFQTHCLTHRAPRRNKKKLQRAQMRGRNLNYWDTPPVQTYTFYFRGFWLGFLVYDLFLVTHALSPSFHIKHMQHSSLVSDLISAVADLDCGLSYIHAV